MVASTKRIVTIQFNWTSKKKESDYEVVKEILPEYELIVDSYEQVRERPRNNQE